MSIKAEIVADSLSPKGCRLTTFVLEYPRFVHAELMTHRVFSRNAASSRAIPIEKMIEQVQQNPAVPVWWGKNQSGMQAREELDDTTEIYKAADMGFPSASGEKREGRTDRAQAKYLWLESRDKAIEQVKKLNQLGLHKQIANRILEPWFNIRLILSGTEYENFFALRVHSDAQPEIQELARQMFEAYNASEPKRLNVGEWHIPFGDKIDEGRMLEMLGTGMAISDVGMDLTDGTTVMQSLKRKIAVARCARISYYNYEGKDDYEADIKLCDRLFGSVPRHLSPTEHVAQATDDDKFIGNFRGFKQYRKFFSDENLSDPRVVKKG